MTHLEKAKAAIEAAAALKVDLDLRNKPVKYEALLTIAGIQAQIAQAEALEGIGITLMRINSELRSNNYQRGGPR